MFILLIGNVIDGLNIVGPFPDNEDAVIWAEGNVKNEEWITTKLHNPE